MLRDYKKNRRRGLRRYRQPKNKLGDPTRSSQHQSGSHSTPRNKDAQAPKLPSFIDEKDELDSYLLRFERYSENADKEKATLANKLSALLTGSAMDVYTRISDADANDYDKLKKCTWVQFHQKRFTKVKPETEETPVQFVIRLKTT